METQWIKELKSNYIEKRNKSLDKKLFNYKNFWKRIISDNKAYQEIIDEDINFSSNYKKHIIHYFRDKDFNKKEIEEAVLYLKNYLSKNEERTKFLVKYPIFLTFFIIMNKFEPLELITNILIIFLSSLITFFVIPESIEHIRYKHSIEELILLLEEYINNIE